MKPATGSSARRGLSSRQAAGRWAGYDSENLVGSEQVAACCTNRVPLNSMQGDARAERLDTGAHG